MGLALPSHTQLLTQTADVNTEYNDDTTIIPRSTTVIARRLPAIRPGKGGAARYVSGKMPQSAKNLNRQEATTIKLSSTPANGITNMAAAQTEEQKVAAFMEMGADQWAQQKQEMAR